MTISPKLLKATSQHPCVATLIKLQTEELILTGFQSSQLICRYANINYKHNSSAIGLAGTLPLMSGSKMVPEATTPSWKNHNCKSRILQISLKRLYDLESMARDSHSKLHMISEWFWLPMSKLLMAQGSAKSSIGCAPCSTRERIPSSEHIITGNSLEEGILVIFDCEWPSNCTSHTSLSEIRWDCPSPLPTPERTIGCCGHLRSQVNTVPEDPPNRCASLMDEYQWSAQVQT